MSEAFDRCWKIEVRFAGYNLDTVKSLVANLAKEIAEVKTSAEFMRLYDRGGQGDDFGGIVQSWFVNPSTPLEAKIEQTKRDLADLEAQRASA